MPAIPESTKTSLAQRLRAHVKQNWPQLAAVDVRFRGQFAASTEETFDLVCDLHVGPVTPRSH